MPSIYWIITTSLIEKDFEKRKEQYIRGIQSVLTLLENTDIKIIIVENNGKRPTFFEMFSSECSIYYTENNKLETHYGVKELYDVLSCIDHFQIQDDDYVIKMTGRYYLNTSSCPFTDEIKKLNSTNYDTIIKYGWWEKPSSVKVEDCILGLICMKAKYIKQIDTSFKIDHLEHRWARVTLPIEDKYVKAMDRLGIYISPGSIPIPFEM